MSNVPSSWAAVTVQRFQAATKGFDFIDYGSVDFADDMKYCTRDKI